jgi:hypothetical protein
MRAKGKSPTSAIAPPAYVANNNFNRSGISNFHCRNEDVNRATYVKKDNNAILWFILWIVIAPVAMIIIQIELNKFATTGGSAVVQQATN